MNENLRDPILDWSKTKRREGAGRPKGSFKTTSKYKVSECSITPAMRKEKPTIYSNASYTSMQSVVRLFFSRMAPKYITHDEKLTAAGVARGWRSTEEAKAAIVKAIQYRLDPTVDWDEEA
jgi:hypothetical protein